MQINLTNKEKEYYRNNYSVMLTEGLELFKKCSSDVLTYIIETLEPMTDATDVMSRKTLLTMAAVAYAKSELMKEIMRERKEKETRSRISFPEEKTNKFDLSKI